MVRRLANVRPPPRSEDVQSPLALEQVLEILFEAVPHTPAESQLSFISMFRDNTSNHPSHEALNAPHPPVHPPLFSDSLHSYLHAKTIQHLTESDLAFEEKQRVAKRTSKRSGGSKGIVKRYDKPQRNQAEEKATPMVAFPLMDPHTTLHGVVWSNGGTTMHRNRQVSCSLPADPSIQRRNLAPMDPPSSASTRTDPPV